MWFPVRNKFFKTFVEVSPHVRKKINGCKNMHIRLATIFNQFTFLERCKRYGILPVSFLLHIPFNCKTSMSLRKRIGRILLAQRIRDLHAEFTECHRLEPKLRQELGECMSPSDFSLTWLWILHVEQNTFCKKRISLINKFELLHQRSLPTLKVSETKPNSHSVINLSSYLPSDRELRLLAKGLSYVPIPSNILTLNFKADLEVAAKSISDHVNDALCGSFISNIMENRASTSSFNSFNYDQAPLRSLRNNKNIIILNSDKGHNVVIMDRQSYVDNVELVLATDSYKKCDSNPHTLHFKDLKKYVNSLNKQEVIDKDCYKSILKNSTKSPSLYANPKTHKLNNPMRLIVSTCGTAFSALAKMLVPLLKPLLLLFHDNAIIKNSEDAVKIIRKSNASNKILASFDVTNLFGSVPVDTVLDLIYDLLLLDPTLAFRTLLTPMQLINGIKICLNATFFSFNDIFYQQVRGLAMGSPISPILADLFMCNLECKMKAIEGYLFVDFLIRYVDDELVNWTGTDEELNTFCADINKLDTNIDFTIEKESNGVLPFLDLSVSRKDDHYVTTMYSKPLSSGLVLNYNSQQPLHIKSGVIKGFVKKIQKCSDDIKGDLNRLSSKLSNNDYPRSFINRTILSSTKVCNNVAINSNDYCNTNRIFIPYVKGLTHNIKKVCKYPSISVNFKSNKNLGAIFASGYKVKDKSSQIGCVYYIPCLNCQGAYIGESGRDLKIRISEHLAAIKKNNRNNAIAVHCNTFMHNMNWDNAKVLAFEFNLERRKFKEALFIKDYLHDGIPLINSNKGWDLKFNW